MKNTNAVSAAHTPSPWRWDAQTGYIVGADHKTVAGFDHPSNKPERLANARLIAAAPELLEALVAMVGIFDNEGPNVILGSRHIAQARAAIVKATEVIWSAKP